MLFGTASTIYHKIGKKKKKLYSVWTIAHAVDSKKKNVTGSSNEQKISPKQQQNHKLAKFYATLKKIYKLEKE